DWRWMLGVEAIPAVIYSILCFSLPESPRWLIGKKRDREGGKAVLRMVNPGMDNASIDALADEIAHHYGEDKVGAGFWSARLKLPIALAFLIAFFNQLSGINAILYFAPRIFEEAGFAAQAAILKSVGLGVTNLIFTFVGL